MQNKIKSIISDSLETHQKILDDAELQKKTEELCTAVINSLKKGGTLFLCGNGGSAADAQHIAAEFTSRFLLERKGYSAIALTTDTSFLTAYANDYNWEGVFARQLEALGKTGDILLGLSTSGKSKNIIEAFKQAKKQGIKTVAFTGEDSGALKDLSDILIQIPAKVTARVQEGHVLIYHVLCLIAEEQLASSISN